MVRELSEVDTFEAFRTVSGTRQSLCRPNFPPQWTLLLETCEFFIIETPEAPEEVG